MHTYKVLCICGFVTIGTDIKEIVEKLKRCRKWNLFWWWHLNLGVWLCCQHSKRWKGRACFSGKDSEQASERYKSGVTTECSYWECRTRSIPYRDPVFSSTDPPQVNTVAGGNTAYIRLGKFWIKLLKALVHRLLCEHNVPVHSGKWGFSGSHHSHMVQW